MTQWSIEQHTRDRNQCKFETPFGMIFDPVLQPRLYAHNSMKLRESSTVWTVSSKPVVHLHNLQHNRLILKVFVSY
jgi:hypothetical protein